MSDNSRIHEIEECIETRNGGFDCSMCDAKHWCTIIHPDRELVEEEGGSVDEIEECIVIQNGGFDCSVCDAAWCCPLLGKSRKRRG